MGSWEGEPPPFGLISPHYLTLNPDGTGRESSGVGSFDCRWEPLSELGAVVTLRITHTGNSYWTGKPSVLNVELVGPDTIRIDGRVHTRRRR